MPYTQLDDRLREKLSEYKDTYNNAEAALKLFEIKTGEGLIFPAVNELRYAGQHLCRSLDAATSADAVEEMERATRHVRRAIYDAYDAGINFYIEKCRSFKDDYKNEVPSAVNPDYVSEKKKLQDLTDTIAEEDRQEKETYAGIKQQQFILVRDITTKWELCREELNTKIRKDKFTSRIMISSLVVAISGLIVTIILTK